MLFSWLRGRRRRQILQQPFPAAWRDHLQRNLWQWPVLPVGQQEQLLPIIQVLVAEKNWEGCAGLQLNPEIQVTIAAQAGVMLLGLEHDYFTNVRSILVYPSRFLVPRKTVSADGVVHESEDTLLGEAAYRGAVVISWEDALAAGRREAGGMNVVAHEFAHQLDWLDGVIDGTPPLPDREQHARWVETMSEEYRLLQRQTARGRATLLDSYGAESEVEFFAVATECFFERPWPLRARHPALYGILAMYFGQDPAATWALPHSETTG